MICGWSPRSLLESQFPNSPSFFSAFPLLCMCGQFLRTCTCVWLSTGTCVTWHSRGRERTPSGIGPCLALGLFHTVFAWLVSFWESLVAHFHFLVGASGFCTSAENPVLMLEQKVILPMKAISANPKFPFLRHMGHIGLGTTWQSPFVRGAVKDHEGKTYFGQENGFPNLGRELTFQLLARCRNKIKQNEEKNKTKRTSQACDLEGEVWTVAGSVKVHSICLLGMCLRPLRQEDSKFLGPCHSGMRTPEKCIYRFIDRLFAFL